MNEVHFYSSKTRGMVMLVISGVFTWILLYFDFYRESYFSLIVLCLGLGLFLFGIIFSLLLLLRRKPLLTVSDKQIIIYSVLRKPKTINFEEVIFFFESDMKYHGIKTSEYICALMKFREEKPGLLDRISAELMPGSQNIKYSIQTDILQVETKTLLELLNSRIRPYNLLNNEIKG
ncbi:hypothetical protein DRF59_17435 [Chryseobacterium flavum]|uniref:Uncharacterized protein n=1 Tax=Chryseobacterium flavum TaxID=415851 RepID=A0A3D9CHB8_9FLAO|nr:STM3941 family protein [Chryseobacterium flavum]REC65106.1 hypothetical protein DRF59_17435 [Chryseobacterium flavum]